MATAYRIQNSLILADYLIINDKGNDILLSKNQSKWVARWVEPLHPIWIPEEVSHQVNRLEILVATGYPIEYWLKYRPFTGVKRTHG